MAVVMNGETTYEGAVVDIWDHYWLDGMMDEFATVWDMEAHEFKDIKVGYYGSDYHNFIDGYAEVDATEAVKRDMRRTFKKSALKAFADKVIAYKNGIRKGSYVEVMRGRKVEQGTKLRVFWVGEKPTYRASNYPWMKETETIVGGFAEDGEKVFVKAEYCKVLDKPKSPNAKERKEFIKEYVEKRIRLSHAK